LAKTLYFTLFQSVLCFIIVLLFRFSNDKVVTASAVNRSLFFLDIQKQTEKYSLE